MSDESTLARVLVPTNPPTFIAATGDIGQAVQIVVSRGQAVGRADLLVYGMRVPVRILKPKRPTP